MVVEASRCGVFLLVGMGRLVRVAGNLDQVSYIDTLNEQNRIIGNVNHGGECAVVWGWPQPMTQNIVKIQISPAILKCPSIIHFIY